MGNLTVVIDIGQFSTKIGFAGEDSPAQVFLTMVGKPKYQSISIDYSNSKSREDELYVGDEIQSIGLYKIFHPIEKGIIIDWKHFENIVNYIFYNLRVDPSLVNVLLAVHPLFPRKDLEKIFELFLEQLQCMNFYQVLDSMLTVYS